MLVDRCALGVIQKRGHAQIQPQIMVLGPAESDYFAKHVEAVREYDNGSPVAEFAKAAGTPTQLQTLSTTGNDAVFVNAATNLQTLLAEAMKTTSSAKDCVFGVIRTTDPASSSPQVSVLKLDAVVEAAQWKLLQDGKMDFRVLTDLLPEPGELQKGLSWPDERTASEVHTVDRNSVAAQYFELAFGLLVSSRAREAEAALIRAVSSAVAPSQVEAVLREVQDDGPLDQVLERLAQRHPALAEAAESEKGTDRPSGRVRARSVSGRTLAWDADGIQVRVPGHLMDRVVKRQTSQGWELVITTHVEPRLGPA
jgi:hypothetical protein